MTKLLSSLDLSLKKTMSNDIPLWAPSSNPSSDRMPNCQNICIASIVLAFCIGLLTGVFIPSILSTSSDEEISTTEEPNLSLDRIFIRNNYSQLVHVTNHVQTEFLPVKFVEDDGIIEDDVFWGRKIEESLPKGFSKRDCDQWIKYVDKSVAVRLEPGCGRMQNRMVVFQDGTKGCVRYRQNLDQIQGELFSFYLAQLLQIPNLAPSTISLIDMQTVTWKNIGAEIAAAQWSANRPVVVTKFIPDLNNANIPQGFRPPDRHLSKKYVLERNTTNPNERRAEFVELAQWSDLVVFDYLTANLDRVVNNLYNKQWNVNIMEAPAHNLARNSENLLVFLDNESGLLHGYRLLHKYEPYHSLLLENLCVFRKRTINIIDRLRREKNIGKLLIDMFEAKTVGGKVKEYLPSLPEKSVKILSDRIEKVYSQVMRCKRNVLKGL